MSRSRPQNRQTPKSIFKLNNSNKRWARSIEQAAVIPATHSHFLNELVKRESQRPLSTQDQIALALAVSMIFVPTASAMLQKKTAKTGTDLSTKSPHSTQQQNEPIVLELLKTSEPKFENKKKPSKKRSDQSAKMMRMKDLRALDEFIKQKEKEANFSSFIHNVDEVSRQRVNYHRKRLDIIKDELKDGLINLEEAKNKVSNAILINIPATYFTLIDTTSPHPLLTAQKALFDAFMATEYKDLAKELNRIENLSNEIIRFEPYEIILKLFKYHYKFTKQVEPKEAALTLGILRKFFLEYLDKLFAEGTSKLKIRLGAHTEDKTSEIQTENELEKLCLDKIDEQVNKYKDEFLQWFKDASLSKINSADILTHYNKVLPQIEAEIERFVYAKQTLASNKYKLMLEIKDTASTVSRNIGIFQEFHPKLMDKFMKVSASLEEKLLNDEIGLIDTIAQLEVAKDLIIFRHTYDTFSEYIRTALHVLSLEGTAKEEFITAKHTQFLKLQVKIETELNNFDSRLQDNNLENEKIVSAIENFKEFSLLLKSIGLNKQEQYLESILKAYYNKWIQPKLEKTISSVRAILKKIVSTKNYSAEVEKMIMQCFEADVLGFINALNASTEVIFQNLDKLTLDNIEKSLKNVVKRFLSDLKQRIDSDNFLDDLLSEQQIEQASQRTTFAEDMYVLFRDHYYVAMSASFMTLIVTLLFQWPNIQKLLEKRQARPHNLNKAKKKKFKGKLPKKTLASKPRNPMQSISSQAVTHATIQLKIIPLNVYLTKFKARLQQIETLHSQTQGLQKQIASSHLNDKARHKGAKYQEYSEINVKRPDFLDNALKDCQEAQAILEKINAELTVLTKDTELASYAKQIEVLTEKYGQEYLTSEQRRELAVYEEKLGELHHKLETLNSSQASKSSAVQSHKASLISNTAIHKRLERAKRTTPVITLHPITTIENPCTETTEATPQPTLDDRIGGTLLLSNKSLSLFQAGPSTSTVNPIEDPLQVRGEGKTLSRHDAIIFHMGKLQRLINKSKHEGFHDQAIMLHLTKICNIAIKIDESNEQKLRLDQLRLLKDLRLALVHPAIFSLDEEAKLQLFKNIARALLTWHTNTKRLPETLVMAITSNIQETDLLKDLIARVPVEQVIQPREIYVCEFIEEKALQNNLCLYTATILEYNEKLSDDSIRDNDKSDYCSAILNLNMRFNETVKQLSRFTKFSELRAEKIHTSQVTTLRNVAAHETREYNIEEIKKFVRVNFCDYLADLEGRGINLRYSPQAPRRGM